jgi:alpha-amylase
MNSAIKNLSQHLVIYFQVHQPRRFKSFRFFDIGSEGEYFDDKLNTKILKRIAKECYLPVNEMLLKLISGNPDIKIAFSLSGTVIEQLEEHAPEVLKSFRALAATGSVEFMAETYHHSLACLVPGDEFEIQVMEHMEKIHYHFGVRPTVFRNTELIYNDELGQRISNMGFEGAFCEGAHRVLGHRSPHQVYHHPADNQFKLLLRNAYLSDEISFRYDQGHTHLTLDKWMSVLNAVPSSLPVINLAMDYETFGEHHKKESGIIKFLEDFLKAAARQKKFKLSTPAEVLRNVSADQKLSIPDYLSWADEARDLSAWLGNVIQQDAFNSVVRLQQDVLDTNDDDLLKIWRHFLTSDHFYYMSTKKHNDGNVHTYFSHYPSPYEAFINYMNALADFTQMVEKAKEEATRPDMKNAHLEFERRHEDVPLWVERYAGSYDHGHLGH